MPSKKRIDSSHFKALILSGGKGTRLRPISHTSAKQLIPVANKPILFYGIESIVQSGIKEIGIVVGDTRKEIEAAVGDGSRWGIRVIYIPQAQPLGLAHAVKISEPFLGKNPFVMYLGDNLLRDGIATFVREFKTHRPNAQILLTPVPHPEQFGVAELKNGKVVRLEEKPAVPKSNLALAGIYLFDHHIFEVIKELKPSARGELEITDAIQKLIDKGFKVRPHLIKGWWKDTGRPEDLLEANRIILETIKPSHLGQIDSESRIEGSVVIEPGARIVRSTIRGPAIIGERTVIEDSYIGPFTAIYHDVTIQECEIEHSIILAHSRIERIRRIESSLIGQHVEVTRRRKRPEIIRLVLGDSSIAELP